MTCRTRQACEHDHAVSGEFQIHILEVVLAGTLHHDFEIIGQVADVGHQIAIVFLEGRLAELPAQERVARHHLFHDRFPARPCIMICQGIPPVRHRSFHAVCMRSAYVYAVSYINSTQKSNTCSIVGRVPQPPK